MYSKNGRTISAEQAQNNAQRLNLSVQEWADTYGWQLSGKAPGSDDVSPATDPTTTPAGDSSSGDISLESQDLNPFLLTEEDIQGSEDEVYDKISGKLKAIGIDTEEYIPGLDGIKLISK